MAMEERPVRRRAWASERLPRGEQGMRMLVIAVVVGVVSGIRLAFLGRLRQVHIVRVIVGVPVTGGVTVRGGLQMAGGEQQCQAGQKGDQPAARRRCDGARSPRLHEPCSSA